MFQLLLKHSSYQKCLVVVMLLCLPFNSILCKEQIPMDLNISSDPFKKIVSTVTCHLLESVYLSLLYTNCTYLTSFKFIRAHYFHFCARGLMLTVKKMEPVIMLLLLTIVTAGFQYLSGIFMNIFSNSVKNCLHYSLLQS